MVVSILTMVVEGFSPYIGNMALYRELIHEMRVVISIHNSSVR